MMPHGISCGDTRFRTFHNSDDGDTRSCSDAPLNDSGPNLTSNEVRSYECP